MGYFIRKIKERFWKEQWSIAVFRGKASDLLEGQINQNDLQWLFSDYKKGFCADPFVIEDGKSVFLFYEQFEYDKQKGRIMVSELIEDEDGKITTTESEVAIERDKHISYPFVFSFNGEMFMIPETSAENEIALYKAIDFPLKWERERVLIPNFAGIDATLHFADGKWWIFCSNAKSGANENLYIFYAEDLFGIWQEHKKNPVKIDIEDSRMAGSFLLWKGKTIRVAQNCKRTYGEEVVLNELEILSIEDFKEKELYALSLSNKSEYSEGMHTISASEHFVAIDAKRFLGIRKYLDKWNSKRKVCLVKVGKVFQKKSLLGIIKK